MKSSYRPRSSRTLSLAAVLVIVVIVAGVFAFADTTTRPTGSALLQEAASPTVDSPTNVPAEAMLPTAAPTDIPTDVPTEVPTDIPTDVPTEAPTNVPTEPAPTATLIEVTPEVTVEPSATATITEVPTEAATTFSPPAAAAMPFMAAAPLIASCQLDVNDAGDTNPFTFTFQAINTTDIIGYAWDFNNDGTTDSSLQGPMDFTYPAIGSYTVRLACTPSTGADLVLTGSVSINNTVTAQFSAAPGTSGYAPYVVNLFNNSIGGSLSFLWEVTGPETFSSTQDNPSFTLSQVGTYTVTLTATDPGGQVSVASATIVVAVPPPDADFSLQPVAGTAPLTVTVNGILNSGTVSTWEWDFDGNSSTIEVTGQGPHNYTYGSENTHSITLYYSGPGGSGSVTRQVGVYPSGDAVDADFTYSSEGNDGTGVRICFTNTSTGPFVTSIWNFGSGNVVDNNATVCHIFAEGNFTVTLRVEASDANVNSTANRTVTATRAPLASFTASSTSVNAGDTVNFTDTSTGTITNWAWDFDNDGAIDSTVQNPTNIAFDTIGGFPVTLTVSGPGGSSSTQMIIAVSRREITCGFTATSPVAPGTTVTFNGTVNDLRGRVPTYAWTISRPDGTTITASTEDVSQVLSQVGAHLVTYSASTADGASCTDSATVQVQWPALTCSLGGNFTPAPNGTNYTYPVTVTGASGRTLIYTWTVNGGASSETTNTLTRSWSVPAIGDTVKVVVTTADGTGGCEVERTFNVEWPALTCDYSGTFTAIPTMPDQTRTHTYTASVGGDAGRTLTYEWYDASNNLLSSTDTMTRSWAWNEEATYDYRLRVVADNRDGTTTACEKTRTVTVDVPNMTCGAATGDAAPVYNEIVIFGRNLGSQYGRTITAQTWTLQQNISGTWTTILTGIDPTLTYQFNIPGATYRVRYSTSVTQPDYTCTSNWKTITVPIAGVDFSCDAWVAGNNYSPNSASTNYTYRVTIDNTLGYTLLYTWVLRDSSGNERVLDTQVSTIDGNVTSPAISGGAMGPADNYTLRVDVAAVNPADTPYTCSLSQAMVVGTLNVNYTYTVNRTAVEVNTPICLTNTSATSHNDINSMTYVWDFGTATNSLNSQTSTDVQPPCVSFPNSGTYTIKLTGTTLAGTRNAQTTVTFNVHGSQSVAINRTSQTHAPANITFNAVGVNVSAPYTWTFRNAAGTVLSTQNGQSRSYNFTTAGRYSAQVSVSGPLGVTTATTTFDLLGADDVRAAFRPGTYGGLAPMQVCFTDRSVGNNIIEWAWNFGNGQTATTTTASQVCTTYSDPGQSYNVTLVVRNAAGNTATASNIVRTFNLVESNATFKILPQGSGRYCFQSVLDAGVSVTGWDYGDTSTGGPSSYTCYTYRATGSYLVTMNITDGTNTGSISRPVDVNLTTTVTPPSLTVTQSCSSALAATFTLRNTGGNMLAYDRVVIRNAQGTPILTDDYLLLTSGQSKTYTVNGYYGTLTLSTTDTSVAVQNNCAQPPILTTSSAQCAADGVAVFTIRNTSANTAANQAYEIRTSGGTLVQSGTLTVAVGGSQEIRVTNTYGALTLTSDNSSQGPTTTLSLSTNCAQPPVLTTSSAQCATDGVAVFTIRNTSTGSAANQPYEIRTSGGTLVQSGTVNAAAGGSQEIRVTNTYGPLTLTSSSTTGQGPTATLSLNTNCAQPPVLTTSSAQCTADGTAVFTIRNTSSVSTGLAANQPYEIRDSGGVVVLSGTVTAMAGGSQEIRVTNTYAALTLTSASTTGQGPTTSVSLNTNCAEPPVLTTSSGQCELDGTAVFTVRNTSTGMPANQPYEIRNSANQLIQSGTLNIATGAVKEIRIQNIHGLLTLTSSSTTGQGPTAAVTFNTNCAQPPVLRSTSVCDNGSALFTVYNRSTGSASNQPYTITDVNGTLVVSGMLQTGTNSSEQIRVPNVTSALTFRTAGPEGPTTVTQVSASCALTPPGSPPPTLPPGSVVGGTSGGGGSQPQFLGVMSLIPGPVDPSLPRPEWDGVTTGGQVCEDWVLYHTDITGDWEVFRLGEHPRYPDANPNLSQGRGDEPGETVTDMAPTRSPDGEWIAFTSERDENWELYLSKLDNSIIRRITFNTVAKDIDPVWSPDGRYLVFESDRDGNWELYLFDLATGEERRMTENPASDINAYWSADSQRLVFQSDRTGQWQVFELDITTRIETYLSDGQGNDHDPAYSFDGSSVVFRSYRSDSSVSVLYLMDADGGNVQRISDLAGDASNHTWYLDDSIIAYQSDLGGDLDIYIYELATNTTRLVTDNVIPDFAPTWQCSAPIVVFTSEVTGDPNIFNTPALPIEAEAILVDEEANQMTTDPSNDVYPENVPSEENASREGNVPPLIAELNNTGG